MPLFTHHRDESLQWGVWKIEESVDVLLELLPERDCYEEMIQKFATVHRRVEWLSVRALLYRMLGVHKEIAYLPSGKPYLTDDSFYVSISHTKEYAAVIISDAKAVSIDIEQYGERIRRVAHKFMRDDEARNLYMGDDVWSLLLHWSAKEVMFKSMSVAEVDFRQHLHIEPFVIQEQGSFCACEYRSEFRRRFLIHYLIHPDFVLTWQAG